MFKFEIITTDKKRLSVEAAYFKDEDGFIYFKDCEHGVVLMIRSGSVESVKRVR